MAVNKFVENLNEYKLVAHKFWEIKDKESTLKLDWNESTVLPTPKVAEKVQHHLSTLGPQYYPDVLNKELLNLIANYSDVTQKNVQYYPGSDSAHEAVIKTFVQENDNVLIMAPTYDQFRVTCEASGANIFFNYEENITEAVLNEEIRKNNICMVYICNPNNPDGRVTKKETIEQIIQNNKDCLFLIDEAYYEFGGESSTALVMNYDNILISRTFSKAFGIAGYRIGYIVSSETNIKLTNKVRNSKNITSLAQIAATECLKDIDYMQSYVSEVMKSKVYFENEIKKVLKAKFNIKNEAGNFILLIFELPHEKNFFINELEKKNIFVRDLSHLKNIGNAIRITIGTLKQMKYTINILETIYED